MCSVKTLYFQARNSYGKDWRTKLVMKILHVSSKRQKCLFYTKYSFQKLINYSRDASLTVFETAVQFSISLIDKKLTTEHFRRVLWDFLLFGEICNLGGRGSISTNVSIKIKLWTHKLVDSFSKHSSSIKLQLKSAEHHSWVFTETDVWFLKQKWGYVQIGHLWRQVRQYQECLDLFSVWVHVGIYEKSKEIYILLF